MPTTGLCAIISSLKPQDSILAAKSSNNLTETRHRKRLIEEIPTLFYTVEKM
jgi:hypothetical protein